MKKEKPQSNLDSLSLNLYFDLFSVLVVINDHCNWMSFEPINHLADPTPLLSVMKSSLLLVIVNKDIMREMVNVFVIIQCIW
jgi:hypothetical protein